MTIPQPRGRIALTGGPVVLPDRIASGQAVIVAGNTDSIGTDAYNMKLSRRRADAVRDYLIQHGIPATRITVEANGESKPVASNDTADGRAQNRRVELNLQ